MSPKFNLIVARCQNKGIGYKGDLPWSLRTEMRHFNRMTSEVNDPNKKNAVVMGRRTWESLPTKLQPLPNRFNFVLSSQSLNLKGAVSCKSYDDLVKALASTEYADKVETVWVIGGTKVYEEALELDLCHRVYLTEILKNFECDTFFYRDFSKGFKEVRDEKVPNGLQEENQVQFTYHVYEKI